MYLFDVNCFKSVDEKIKDWLKANPEITVGATYDPGTATTEYYMYNAKEKITVNHITYPGDDESFGPIFKILHSDMIKEIEKKKNKEDSCIFCNPECPAILVDFDFSEEISSYFNIISTLYVERNYLSLHINNDTACNKYKKISTKINYCPMCGRKLKEHIDE